MQIIQGIREKGAAIVIGVIALSLIGFILMDAKQQGNNIFGARSQNIGKINGSSISYDEFKKKRRYWSFSRSNNTAANRTAASRPQSVSRYGTC